MTPRPSRQRGIALILVVWMLALLTLIAMSLTLTQRTETALAENQVAGVRFAALAEAAIIYALWHFVEPPREDELPEEGHWLPNDVPRDWIFAGQSLRIGVSNEASRISLNEASGELLQALMRALDVPDERAMEVADAILDWRDPDDLRLLHGAEEDDYRDAGRPLGPKNEPFASVDELRQVLGVDRDLYRRLAPELTVSSLGAMPVEAFASAAVLAAIHGIALAEAELRIATRDAPLFAGTPGAAPVDLGGPQYRIRIEETGPEAGGRRLEALVELMPGDRVPYQILWRREGWTPRAPATPDTP